MTTLLRPDDIAAAVSAERDSYEAMLRELGYTKQPDGTWSGGKQAPVKAIVQHGARVPLATRMILAGTLQKNANRGGTVKIVKSDAWSKRPALSTDAKHLLQQIVEMKAQRRRLGLPAFDPLIAECERRACKMLELSQEQLSALLEKAIELWLQPDAAAQQTGATT